MHYLGAPDRHVALQANLGPAAEPVREAVSLYASEPQPQYTSFTLRADSVHPFTLPD